VPSSPAYIAAANDHRTPDAEAAGRRRSMPSLDTCGGMGGWAEAGNPSVPRIYKPVIHVVGRSLFRARAASGRAGHAHKDLGKAAWASGAPWPAVPIGGVDRPAAINAPSPLSFRGATASRPGFRWPQAIGRFGKLGFNNELYGRSTSLARGALKVYQIGPEQPRGHAAHRAGRASDAAAGALPPDVSSTR